MAEQLTISELKQKINGFEKIRDKPNQDAGIKKAMEAAIAGANKKIEELEKAEKKPAAPKSDKKKSDSKPKKEKKPKVEKLEPDYITVKMRDGKEFKFDLNNPEEACEAMLKRHERDLETNKASKSRSTIQRAETNLENVVGNLVELIPDKTIKENPEDVISAIESAEKHFAAGFDAMKKAGVSQGNIDRLKKVLDELSEAVKEIRNEIQSKKQ